MWFLREGEHGDRWADHVVVDSLRTWWPARLLDLAGAATLAARLRGLRMRWWYRRVDPDAVVLDDGLGARVVPAHAAPVIIERINELGNPDAELEDPHPRRVQARIGAGTALVDTEMFDVTVVDSSRGVRLTDGELPVVVGWGHLTWWNAPDVFARTVWHLERRLGRSVHGVWFSTEVGDEVQTMLTAEAARCDMSSTVEFRRGTPPAGWTADAVLLPHRGAPDLSEIVECARRGLAPVSFAHPDGYGELTDTVGYLNLAEAAQRLAEQIERGPNAELMSSHPGLYPDGWIDVVVDQVNGGGRWPHVSV